MQLPQILPTADVSILSSDLLPRINLTHQPRNDIKRQDKLRGPPAIFRAAYITQILHPRISEFPNPSKTAITFSVKRLWGSLTSEQMRSWCLLGEMDMAQFELKCRRPADSTIHGKSAPVLEFEGFYLSSFQGGSRQPSEVQHIAAPNTPARIEMSDLNNELTLYPVAPETWVRPPTRNVVDGHFYPKLPPSFQGW